MKKEVLSAKAVTKSYPVNKTANTILDSIDLTVFENESIAIMGASGEGKTTLLHILGGLEDFESGSINILDRSKFSNKLINENIGYIFQTYNLLEDISVIDNVLMPAKIARKDINKLSDSYRNAIELLNEINLYHKKDDISSYLSGGEKQRVAIARAFCNSPDIILADEPSGNLDHNNSKIIHKLLIDSAKKYKKCLIVATHDLELAKMCDRVFMLKDKKLYPFNI